MYSVKNTQQYEQMTMNADLYQCEMEEDCTLDMSNEPNCMSSSFHIYNELQYELPLECPALVNDQESSPLAMPILNPNASHVPNINPITSSGIIYGFRTRHLSCIEENDSDSLHSSSIPQPLPFEMMQAADDDFKKLVTHIELEDTTFHCATEDEDTIAMIDESRLYEMDYLDELSASKHAAIGFGELASDEEHDAEAEGDGNGDGDGETEDAWQSTVSEPLLLQRRMRPAPDIMMTSCYGSLNSPFGDETVEPVPPVTSTPTKVRQRQDPIYATPEKRREANRSFDSSCQSANSSVYGGFEAPYSLTSSLDLKCLSGSSMSVTNSCFGSSFTAEISGGNTMASAAVAPTGIELAKILAGGSVAEELSEEMAAKCLSNAENDLQSIRRLLEHDASGTICPSCRIAFDKGKRRKLIDMCGHEVCYSCMFRNDQCPMCMNGSLKDVDGLNAQGGYDTGIGGSTSTIVSPLGSPQPQLRSQVQRANAAAILAKYMQQSASNSNSSSINNSNNNIGRQDSLSPEYQQPHQQRQSQSQQQQQQHQQQYRYASIGKLPIAITTHTVTADIHQQKQQANQTNNNNNNKGNNNNHFNKSNNFGTNSNTSNSNSNTGSSIEHYSFHELNSASGPSGAPSFATPPTRRRFFNHKNLRSALTGHRRAASSGGGNSTGSSSIGAASPNHSGVCPIDAATSILTGDNDHLLQEHMFSEKHQKDQLRARLGLLLDNDQNGNVTSSNATMSSSSSQNICLESSSSSARVGIGLKANGGVHSVESFGSQLSVAMKDDAISLSSKFKAACTLQTDSNGGYDSGPMPVQPSFPAKARKNASRRSARTAQMNGASNVSGGASAASKRQAIYKPAPIQLPLKPLFFEVPLQEPDPPFIGRQWLLRELSNILTGTETPGVLINGNPGTGKTALILQLVEYSCFGRRKDTSAAATDPDGIYCQINLGLDRIRALASHVVGYHFCQADANLTCLVADFVHSLAAQLCQAPQLSAYRDYLISEPHLQDILGVKECIADAERVMRMAILEPLTILKRNGKIHAKTCIILVDALCEAEYHRPDHGHTIATFLAKMTQYFPAWLKVVATVRTQMIEFVKGLCYTKMTLDSWATNDLLQKDMLDYITFRINHSAQIQCNVAPTMAKESSTGQIKFVGHLQSLTRGSMLYAKLILDLIERGQLVIKSSSYKVLPVSLAQIFLLHFNLRFPTSTSFEKAAPILNVCLAALYPLTLNEIYYTICATKTDGTEHMSWDEFLQRFKLLDGFLIKRIDNTYMFFHSSFREWLIRRDESESTKFLCDFRLGHAAIAFRLSRLQAPLNPELTLELGHHMLKAHIYRNSQQVPQAPPRDMQSYWIASVTENISAALGSLRNVYSPNLKVSRLMLLAGATPHHRTEFMGDATILCIAAHEGIVPMVSLLLEFGADVGLTNSQGCTPLILAAMRGHCDVVRLLVAAGSSLGQTDTTQRCALVHAARMGRLNVVKYLLACDWTPRSCSHDVSLPLALQQALIAAASQDHVTILEDLLEVDGVDINQMDATSGELALTAAARNGCVDTVAVLISRGAMIDARNKQGHTSLWLAVKDGHWAVSEKLLQNGAHVDEAITSTHKTPLMIAAEEGHTELLELLIERGAALEAQDNEGFTALSWACLRGRLATARALIERGCNKQHADNSGRTALDLAAYQGSAALVQFLLEQGANIEHIDMNGMRPLDRAIACRNIQVVQVFLRKGAKLGPTTWSMAMGKPEILVVLLNKLLEDGNVLYRRNRFQEAAHRYQYALRKISNLETLLERNAIFAQLRTNLLLNLSRCKRKLNELGASIDLATQAIAQQPCNYEGYYARAKALMECGELKDASVDANAALERAAQSGVPVEVIEVLRRIQNELLARMASECGAKPIAIDTSTESQPEQEITDL